MNNDYFELLASFRSGIMKQWSLKSGLSPALAADAITESAKMAGLLHSDKKIHGTTFTAWCRGKSPPLWAAQAALLLLLRKGWVPVDKHELAGFTAMLIGLKPDITLDGILGYLTECPDPDGVAEWYREAKIFVYEKNADKARRDCDSTS